MSQTGSPMSHPTSSSSNGARCSGFTVPLAWPAPVGVSALSTRSAGFCPGVLGGGDSVRTQLSPCPCALCPRGRGYFWLRARAGQVAALSPPLQLAGLTGEGRRGEGGNSGAADGYSRGRCVAATAAPSCRVAAARSELSWWFRDGLSSHQSASSLIAVSSARVWRAKIKAHQAAQYKTQFQQLIPPLQSSPVLFETSSQ